MYLDGAQFDCLASPSLPNDQARACMLPWLRQYYFEAQHSAAQHNTAQHSAAQHSTAQHERP